MGAAHRDAMAHLMYGVGQGGAGGFVQLTGEVGTGKTMLCRCLLEQVPEDCRIALVLNPLMTPRELLATVCEELGLDTTAIRDSNKAMVDRLNACLLGHHAQGRRVVVIIDEAQNLSPEALEQVRLLTNLETSKHKLLQMVLLGQPELRQMLQRRDLRQLAQRITARYHLMPLDREETAAYVVHRLQVAGAERNPFRKAALRALYRRSGGVPRLINIIADRALAAAYAREAGYVTARMVESAADEVQPSEPRVRNPRWAQLLAGGLALAVLAAALWLFAPVPWSPPPGQAEPEQAAAVEGGGTVTTGAVSEEPGLPAQAAAPVALDSPPPEADGQGASTPATGEAVDVLLSDLDDEWLGDQHRLAWRSLAELWRDGGHAGALRSACEGVPRTGYGCVRDAGSWSRIRQLGLPVLLVLDGPERRLLLLRGFGPGTVLVGNGDPPLQVAREAVEERWLGEYMLAWPQAADWPVELRRGDAGAAVDLVMQMAALADPAWHGGDRFDADFETWLMAFQRRRGLDADGIIGPNTLIHLLAPTVEQPRLTLEEQESS